MRVLHPVAPFYLAFGSQYGSHNPVASFEACPCAYIRDGGSRKSKDQ